METKPQESQQELFLEFSKEPKKAEPFLPLRKTQKPILISTHLEQLILAGILTILAACLVFFLGVLRGKSLSVSRPVPSSPPMRVPARPVPLLQKTPAPAVSTVPLLIVPDSRKPYTIQLVTYKKKDYAENESALLRRQGFFSIIIPSGEYYQVCAGQYANREESEKDKGMFSARYKGCFLRPR